MELEQTGAESFRLRTGEHSLTYEPESRDDKKGWIMIRRDGVAAKAAADKLSERSMDLMWAANMTSDGVEGCEKLYRATGDQRYRDIAFIPLANVLREAWLWECNFGIGEKTVNFWAISGCPAAPCSAEFETHRTRLRFKNYAALAGDHLPESVRAMSNDAWRRGPTDPAEPKQPSFSVVMAAENPCFRPPLALNPGGGESHQVVRWPRFLECVIKRPCAKHSYEG